MRIKEFKYIDKSVDLEIETSFYPDLTLLVGISGVGKTQILKALSNIKNIADGQAINGVEWRINFITTNGDEYFWSGEYENNPSLVHPYVFFHMGKGDAVILYEKLIRNGKSIIERKDSEIYLNGNKTPKLSPFESILSILNQEEDIAPAYQDLKHVIKSNFSEPEYSTFGEPFLTFNTLRKKVLNLKEIQESNLDTHFKIALIYQSFPDIFTHIEKRFIEIFPQIENIRVEFIKDARNYYDYNREYPALEIKEKAVNHWIRQNNISSGMYKAFMHISELFLCPAGTVILIDEFENSLGVNCIDILTEDLINQNRDLQFIITSHHPYIINNISPKHWKIVTRKGGVITTHDASELHLSESSHKAFIQLINLDEYKEGISVA